MVFVMMPNAAGAEMSRPGGPKLGWFSALNASILNSAWRVPPTSNFLASIRSRLT